MFSCLGITGFPYTAFFVLHVRHAGTRTRCTGALCAGGRVAATFYSTQVMLAVHVTGRVAAARLRLDWSNSRFAAIWLGGLRRQAG